MVQCVDWSLRRAHEAAPKIKFDSSQIYSFIHPHLTLYFALTRQKKFDFVIVKI